jgi:hypothetical protein
VTAVCLMFESLRSFCRKVSFASVAAGLLMAYFCEAFSDIPGRAGRPKPPLARQRAAYLAVIGFGIPGVIWGLSRASKGAQRFPWE